MDKRKRGHSGVTLPRVLLPLLASSNRYADLGLPVHLRKCSLSLSVCPLARTTVRACVRACVHACPLSLRLSIYLSPDHRRRRRCRRRRRRRRRRCGVAVRIINRNFDSQSNSYRSNDGWMFLFLFFRGGGG